jgi:DNA helicase-2/ATP-dependent DNA helicase PcrA
MSLNKPQQKAVDNLSGPILVLAGAGTGKTRVITARIANLIKHKTPAERILGVTFTNKAATEMQQRVKAMLRKRAKSQPVLSTFHSLCLRILRRHIELIGYPKKFSICDRSDQESLARQVLREVKMTEQMLSPSQLLFHVGQWKSHSISPDDAVAVADNDQQHLAAVAFRRYQRRLKNSGAVDFDDLLLCTEQLFREFKDVKEVESARFDHILVDEYQDTNTSQYRIIKTLAVRHRNLFVVGDDDQSIYGWRGAQVENILRFKKDWPDAEVIYLEKNYRSTAPILELSNRLIEFNSVRHEKTLIASRVGGIKPEILQHANETKEAKEIVTSIRRRLENDGIQPRDIAILFRTNEQPRAFEQELRKHNLPYVLVGGMSFFDRKEVRDILAFLRVIDAPDDDSSILRIINTPPRGIGQTSIERIQQYSIEKKCSIMDVLADAGTLLNLPRDAKTGAQQLVETIGHCRNLANEERLAESVQYLIDKIGYQQEIKRLFKDPNEQSTRMVVLEQLVNAVASYAKESGQPSLAEFIDQLTIGDRQLEDEKEKQLAKNAIALMTLHSAKGLEFPEVFIVGLEEGILPHHRSLEDNENSIEEERRLCYVGITRAEERLTLSLALTRMKWGKPRDTIPSRFLYEMTGMADHPKYFEAVAGHPENSRGGKSVPH